MTRRRLIGFASAAPLAAQYEESRGETPWVPTPDDVIDTMLQVAKVTRHDRVLDIGCGDGRILIAAARQYGCRGVGIDIEPERIRESREAARKARLDGRLRFIEGDFHSPVLAKEAKAASVVVIYLFTRVMTKLRPVLREYLRPGTRVVAYQFNGFGDWAPAEVDRRHPYPVYLWVVPQVR